MIRIVRKARPDKPSVSYTLLGGRKYEVGRKTGDICFPDDQSISRNHAEISIDHPPANITSANLTPVVCITDMGSKFGTFANDGIERKTPLSMREKMNLSPGDVFKFGLQWNEFKIEYTPLIATSSAVKDIQQLKTLICNLGAHLLPEWTETCQFVVMESITLTIKAVCALLSAKIIVTPAYFKDLHESYRTGKRSILDPGDYLPELAERQLKPIEVSFVPNSKRSQVFSGKIFMFSTLKLLKKLNVAVKAGNGSTCLISSATDVEIRSPNSILILDSSSVDKPTLEALDKYKKTGKRIVQESEIGLAALHCSTEKHCNPVCEVKKGLFPSRLISQSQQSSGSSNQHEVLVPETQDLETQLSRSSQSTNVVEETLVATGSAKSDASDSEMAGTSKRSHISTANLEGVLPITKRRLAQRDDTFLEPSIKRPCKEKIKPNKTLSNLFDSSDEDEDEQVANNVVPSPILPQTVNTDTVPKRNLRNTNRPVATNAAAVDKSVTVTAKAKEGAATVTNDCKTPDDAIGTESAKATTSVKRKLADENGTLQRNKTRKLNIEDKADGAENIDADFSKVLVLEPGNENPSGTDCYQCKVISMKGLMIKRDPPVFKTDATGSTVINFKRFKKVLPINTSFNGSSIVSEDRTRMQSVLKDHSTNKKEHGTAKSNRPNQIDVEPMDQSFLFELPSTSRRATRATNSKRVSPVPGPSPPKTVKKAVTESEKDFERHVDGDQQTRTTRSGSKNTQSSSRNTRSTSGIPAVAEDPVSPDKNEPDDMWSFK